VLEAEARALNQGFLKRMEHGLPFVRVKLAMSLDGRTAMASGESQWITGPAARSAVQRLRAEAAVVLTGADTVLADGARLTVRADELGLDAEPPPWPCRAAAARADRRPLRVPLDAPFFKAGPALVITCVAVKTSYPWPRMPDRAGCRWPGRPAPALVLAARGVNEVLVEAGPRLAGAFAQQGLVDEFVIFVAGKFLGLQPGRCWTGRWRNGDAPRLKITEMRAVGDDWRVTAIPVPAASV
jgi:diaminohydroxyphosphoribosylaminopyrimidine deaminase/5-amino-6-(5-phosphoribosylamino)uracil reductase